MLRGKVVLVAVLPVIFCFAGMVQAEGQTLRAGASVRIVNPQKPATPVGHGGTTRYLDVHADLCVQAMVIEDETGNRLVWMGWDFCYVHKAVVDRVKKIVQEEYGIAPETFCLNASHTHSAPALLAQEAPTGHFDPEYTDFVVNQAVKVVGDAIGKLAPVKLRYNEYMCTSVGINRRRPPDYSISPTLKKPVDHRVQVVTAESIADGKLICIAVKYACHPVTVGPTGLGSDYPGFMRNFIEKRYPGAVAIFLQGCGGNIRIQAMNDDVTEFVRGSATHALEQAERFGRDLGMSVEWALNKPGFPITGPIKVGYTVIDLPLKKKPTTGPYRIQVFRLGIDSKTPFTLVALQGEVFTEYGLRLEEKLQPANTIVLGYSNDYAGYVPTAQGFKEGGFEPNGSPYTSEAEPMILKAAAKLARLKAVEHE